MQISHQIHCLNYLFSINVSPVCSNHIEFIDSAYADEYASVIKNVCYVFSKQRIISKIVSNVNTKDR